MGLLIQWPAKEITDKLFSNKVGMFVFGVSVGKTHSGGNVKMIISVVLHCIMKITGKISKWEIFMYVYDMVVT